MRRQAAAREPQRAEANESADPPGDDGSQVRDPRQSQAAQTRRAWPHNEAETACKPRVAGQPTNGGAAADCERAWAAESEKPTLSAHPLPSTEAPHRQDERPLGNACAQEGRGRARKPAKHKRGMRRKRRTVGGETEKLCQLGSRARKPRKCRAAPPPPAATGSSRPRSRGCSAAKRRATSPGALDDEALATVIVSAAARDRLRGDERPRAEGDEARRASARGTFDRVDGGEAAAIPLSEQARDAEAAHRPVSHEASRPSTEFPGDTRRLPGCLGTPPCEGSELNPQRANEDFPPPDTPERIERCSPPVTSSLSPNRPLAAPALLSPAVSAPPALPACEPLLAHASAPRQPPPGPAPVESLVSSSSAWSPEQCSATTGAAEAVAAAAREGPHLIPLRLLRLLLDKGTQAPPKAAVSSASPRLRSRPSVPATVAACAWAAGAAGPPGRAAGKVAVGTEMQLGDDASTSRLSGNEDALEGLRGSAEPPEEAHCRTGWPSSVPLSLKPSQGLSALFPAASGAHAPSARSSAVSPSQAAGPSAAPSCLSGPLGGAAAVDTNPAPPGRDWQRRAAPPAAPGGSGAEPADADIREDERSNSRRGSGVRAPTPGTDAEKHAPATRKRKSTDNCPERPHGRQSRLILGSLRTSEGCKLPAADVQRGADTRAEAWVAGCAGGAPESARSVENARLGSGMSAGLVGAGVRTLPLSPASSLPRSRAQAHATALPQDLKAGGGLLGEASLQADAREPEFEKAGSVTSWHVHTMAGERVGERSGDGARGWSPTSGPQHVQSARRRRLRPPSGAAEPGGAGEGGDGRELREDLTGGAETPSDGPLVTRPEAPQSRPESSVFEAAASGRGPTDSGLPCVEAIRPLAVVERGTLPAGPSRLPRHAQGSEQLKPEGKGAEQSPSLSANGAGVAVSSASRPSSHAEGNAWAASEAYTAVSIREFFKKHYKGPSLPPHPSSALAFGTSSESEGEEGLAARRKKKERRVNAGAADALWQPHFHPHNQEFRVRYRYKGSMRLKTVSCARFGREGAKRLTAAFVDRWRLTGRCIAAKTHRSRLALVDLPQDTHLLPGYDKKRGGSLAASAIFSSACPSLSPFAISAIGPFTRPPSLSAPSFPCLASPPATPALGVGAASPLFFASPPGLAASLPLAARLPVPPAGPASAARLPFSEEAKASSPAFPAGAKPRLCLHGQGEAGAAHAEGADSEELLLNPTISANLAHKLEEALLASRSFPGDPAASPPLVGGIEARGASAPDGLAVRGPAASPLAAVLGAGRLDLALHRCSPPVAPSPAAVESSAQVLSSPSVAPASSSAPVLPAPARTIDKAMGRTPSTSRVEGFVSLAPRASPSSPAFASPSPSPAASVSPLWAAASAASAGPRPSSGAHGVPFAPAWQLPQQACADPRSSLLPLSAAWSAGLSLSPPAAPGNRALAPFATSLASLLTPLLSASARLAAMRSPALSERTELAQHVRGQLGCHSEWSGGSHGSDIRPAQPRDARGFGERLSFAEGLDWMGASVRSGRTDESPGRGRQGPTGAGSGEREEFVVCKTGEPKSREVVCSSPGDPWRARDRETEEAERSRLQGKMILPPQRSASADRNRFMWHQTPPERPRGGERGKPDNVPSAASPAGETQWLADEAATLANEALPRRLLSQNVSAAEASNLTENLGRANLRGEMAAPPVSSGSPFEASSERLKHAEPPRVRAGTGAPQTDTVPCLLCGSESYGVERVRYENISVPAFPSLAASPSPLPKPDTSQPPSTPLPLPSDCVCGGVGARGFAVEPPAERETNLPLRVAGEFSSCRRSQERERQVSPHHGVRVVWQGVAPCSSSPVCLPVLPSRAGLGPASGSPVPAAAHRPLPAASDSQLALFPPLAIPQEGNLRAPVFGSVPFASRCEESAGQGSASLKPFARPLHEVYPSHAGRNAGVLLGLRGGSLRGGGGPLVSLSPGVGTLSRLAAE
ncbi:hypothetical protein BESB_030380 [Besnoitia besnoiti]|uniref:AP2 domain transcription factor AP2III-1 n=1 Tax=Besnoitia besnoiti TaxID=94643 RepID=A0A2A9M1P5_BESBE|nr:hypothetical protein BESB_030380 [Besnoitia besnoiti]PFH31164.1 hypothetical protein BESB_030380 [Besnoitia besnoiti]